MSFLNTAKRVFFDVAVPRTRLGDKIAASVDFVLSHGRLPQKGRTFSSNLFEIMTSDEILLAERTFTSDKALVKLFISAVAGQHYNVPTLGILKTDAEIDAFDFDRPCVAKPTHASGMVAFVDETGAVDRARLKKWLRVDYYAHTREANYRNLKPKIIVEPYVFGTLDAQDLKFFCVDGRVKLIQCDFDRRRIHTRRLYDRNWNDTGVSIGKPLSPKHMDRPQCLDDMIGVAEALSSYFSFVRVDMYVDRTGTSFLVGEITHCHGRALQTFSSSDAEERITKLVFGAPDAADIRPPQAARA